MNILRLVLEPDPDRRAEPRAALPLIAKQQRLRAVEREMHGVGRDDGRQHRLVGGDRIAAVDLALRDLARDRREDAGEADVQLPRADVRARRGDVGLGRPQRRLALLDFLDAGRALRGKGARPGELGPGVDRLRFARASWARAWSSWACAGRESIVNSSCPWRTY